MQISVNPSRKRVTSCGNSKLDTLLGLHGRFFGFGRSSTHNRTDMRTLDLNGSLTTNRNTCVFLDQSR
jgi:hypothetical protein